MSVGSKVSMKQGASRNNKFDLSHKVFQTSDFGVMDPIECRYMVPGDVFNYDISKLTRSLPMPSPTFGRIKQVTRAFFVPLKTIFPKIDGVINNSPVMSTGGYSNVTIPYFNTKLLVQALLHILPYEEDGSGVGIREDVDLNVYDDNDKEYHYIIFNHGQMIPPTSFNNYYHGRVKDVFRLLESLGYHLPKVYFSSMDVPNLSALPLLAVHKLYVDWIVPSRYLGSNYHYCTIQGIINDLGNGGILSQTQLEALIYPLCCFYSPDYFTGAYAAPFQDVSPNTAQNEINSPNTNGVQVTQANNPIHQNASGAYFNLTNGNSVSYYTLQSLGKLQDYLNRGLIAGNKLQDWLKSEFGVTPSNDSLQLSHYLGKFENIIEIGAVTSSSDTSESGGLALGQYAGKCLGSGNGKFEVKSNGQHGFVIITHEIIPECTFVNGLSPEFMLTSHTDLFVPDFDNLGFDAIHQYELDCEAFRDYQNMDNPFGFQPRYARLKKATDNIVGDFNRYHSKDALSSWFLSRSLPWGNSVFVNPNYTIVNSVFIDDLDRIFNYTGSDIDHFYNVFSIGLKASRPMLQINEAYEPEHPNSNKEVVVNSNGSLS